MLARHAFLDESLDSIYSASLTIVAGISVLFAPLLTTVIFTQTPKYMKPFHYYLLNLSFWHFFDSFIVTVAWRPVSLFPMPCLGFNGVLRGFGVYFGRFLLHIRSVAIVNVYVAILLCYVYRLAQLSKRPFFLAVMTSRRGFAAAFLIHATVTIVESFPIFFFYVDNSRALSVVPRSDTVIALIAEEPGMICYTVKSVFSVIFIYYGIVIAYVFTISVLVLIVLIQIPFWRDLRSKVSQRTYEMHRTLTISLVFFAVVHILLKAVPVGVGMYLALQSTYYANLVNLLCNFAEVIEPLLIGGATLYFIVPYRRALKNFFRRLKQNVLHTTVVQHVSSNPECT